jgi:phenylacetate-CoA ligase
MGEDVWPRAELAAEALSEPAVARMVAALTTAGIVPDMVVLNGFSTAYGALETLAAAGLQKLGARGVSGEQMLADESLIATAFVGSPDRLFALCQEGYAPVLSHALVGGGAVFPIVHTVAAQHGIVLCDMMSDPQAGPYAVRSQRDEAYALLDGVEVAIWRPGGEDAMPHGMIGEVVLEAAVEGQAHLRTGVLSAMEQVPHRYRKPGLQGWLGFAQPAASVQDHRVQASDMARLVSEVDELLDARLLTYDQDGATPVLQIETEAGNWIEADVLARFEAMTGLRPQIERLTPGRFGNSGRAFALMAA